MTAAAPTLVLASASPRRRQLLAEHGYAATVLPTSVEESTDANLSVRELVLLNAQLKSAALWARFPRAVVLGTDTLVCLDGRALGKPADLPAATGMLGSLAGRWHEVYSGVCLALPAQGRIVCFVEETRVRFPRADHPADRRLPAFDRPVGQGRRLRGPGARRAHHRRSRGFVEQRARPADGTARGRP